jgi:VCBS repeat-containing protein
MRTLRKRTAISARRALVTLLGVLALTGLGAYTVLAAGGKQDFTIAASPSSQTVTKGQATAYTVTVTRVNGFTGSVTLSVSGLPAAASASWRLPDGSSSNVVPPSLNSATLNVQTGAGTPNGNAQPVIKATSGNLTTTTTVTLAVQPPAQPNFTLSASPATRAVVQSDDTTYGLDVSRTGGFAGAVSLAVTGLPKNATATWSPSATVSGSSGSATLLVQTAGNTSADSYTLTITGTGTVSGSTVTRSAAVTLIVQKNQTFAISGNLAGTLTPGRKMPLDLSLTNPQPFDVKVTSVAVTLEESTNKPGCSGTQNFKVTQIPAARYPITLAAGQTRTLAQLGVAAADRPQVEMLNQPWSQDACKNASITLSYGGSAAK